MDGNSACIRVGRLLEVSVRTGYGTADSVDRLFDDLERALLGLPRGQRPVICADWRRSPVMAPETSERLRQRILSVQARRPPERSAAVVSADYPTSAMQSTRLVREAHFSDRRVFTSARAAVDWLSEVLTPAETSRLRAFLEMTGSSASPGTSPR
jgi:hypothetical protein